MDYKNIMLTLSIIRQSVKTEILNFGKFIILQNISYRNKISLPFLAPLNEKCCRSLIMLY